MQFFMCTDVVGELMEKDRKKSIIFMIAAFVLCIIIIAIVVAVRTEVSHENFNVDESQAFNFNEGADESQNDQKQWEHIRRTIATDLKEFNDVEDVNVQPEDYNAYLLNKEIVVNVTLQKGNSLKDDLRKSMETYVCTIIDCEKVKVEEKEE